MANNLVSPSKMSLLSSFRALPPRTRAMIGASFIAWVQLVSICLIRQRRSLALNLLSRIKQRCLSLRLLRKRTEMVVMGGCFADQVNSGTAQQTETNRVKTTIRA
ncbi:hypothetical protein H4I96_05010 [Botrytis cinerea]